MKIAFAHPERIEAGKARWVAIVRTLAAVAQRADVVWFAPDNGDRVREYAASHLGLALPEGLRVQPLPSVRKLAGLTINHVFFRACKRAVADGGADVLWLRSDKLAAHFAHKPVMPLVYEAHLIGPLWARDRGENERHAARLECIERDLYAGASAVAAITHGLLDEVRSRYDFAGPAEVVPSAVEPNVFKPVWSGGDGATIAYVGTLQFWKGLDTLLEAVAQTQLRLVIVGGGSEAEEVTLRRRIADLHLSSRVELAGRRAQPGIPALVRKAACAVHPLPPDHAISARFTSPLKLFEYMAMGLPIVAPDVPSVREVLTHGANAHLYTAGDAASLAAALVEVAANKELASRISQQAVSDSATYSYAGRAEKLLGLFGKAGT